MTDQNRLRDIPSVSRVLEDCLKHPWSVDYSHEMIVGAIREELASMRTDQRVSEPQLTERIHERLQKLHSFSLQRVVNASGIIVHTNLGRSPLAKSAVDHMAEIAANYNNLEFDLEEGQRGSREVHGEKFLRNVLPAAASIVVNNNAAALLLILNSLAEGKEVIVSRGELIEIGGSFRLPEIMRKSGAILREVGTTNKTRISDYEKAIGPNTGMILSVHPSNYQIVGFTEKPELQELVKLARAQNLPIVDDQGSGILLNLEPFGISEEPTAIEQLQARPDLVCFSGDKILGGPQAGIIVGQKEWITKLKNNPLFRALRVDKLIYAALEATLALYLKKQYAEIPVIAMLSQSVENLQKRGEHWLQQLRSEFANCTFELEATSCYVGGGVAPMKALPSVAISISSSKQSSQNIAALLRKNNPPIVARIESDRVYLELRTISTEEQSIVMSAFHQIFD